MSKETKLKRAAWIIAVILVFLSMFALVLKFLPYRLTSDSAFFPLLAHWEFETGQLFPEGMCYSTQVLGLSPNLYMLPYLAIFGNDLLLVRILGVFTIWAVILILVFFLFRSRSIVPASVVCILLLIPYISSAATEEYFFEAGYINQIKWMAVCLLLYTGLWTLLKGGKSAMDDGSALKGKHKSKINILIILSIAVIVYANACGFRNLLISFLPATAAVMILSVFRKQGEYPAQSCPLLQARIKSALPFIMILIIGGICAFLLYHTISMHFWTYNAQTQLTLVSSEQFTQRIMTFINSLLSVCGNRMEAPLFSARGISKIVNYCYAAFLFAGVPWYSLRHYREMKEDKTKIIILTAHISSLIIAFLFISTDLDAVSNDATRYCLPIFVNQIFVLGAVLYEKSTYSADLRHKDNSMNPAWLRCFLHAIPALVLCYALFSHSLFWKVNLSEARLLPDPCGLTDFLKEHGLTHGYAEFWNAHKNTVLSDGMVEVCGVIIGEGRIDPYLWLTNEQYYREDYYSGPTFLILTADEAQLFDASGGAAGLYGKPKEYLQYQDQYIYVYDYNIISYTYS